MQFRFPYCFGRNPVYITERPAIGVDYLFGREHDIEKIEEAVLHRGKVMISGVGGIGKTELVKRFLLKLEEGSSIREIACIPYDNHDLRGSIKQALEQECSIENVWMEIQRIAENAGEDLLLVVDNVEQVGKDEYLSKLGNLPCRILVTSRLKNLPGFPKSIMKRQLPFVRHIRQKTAATKQIYIWSTQIIFIRPVITRGLENTLKEH